METMKFLMTDLGEATAACVSALESRGLEVTVCPRDGAQVLEKLLECRPRAVLLEVFMPGLDALAVKQRYEAQGGTAVFFATGPFQNEEAEQELLESGFAFYYVRPFDEQILAGRALKALGKAPVHRQIGTGSDEVRVSEILHQIGVPAVSYTHLDVYKRQIRNRSK